MLFVQAFNRARNNTDGREVREGHQEDGDNAFSAWREGRGDFLQIHHRHEFVGNQFGRHDTSYLQRFTGRYAHYPCDRVEDVTQNALEGDAVTEPTGNRCEQRVQRRDQRDEADQHRRDDNRHFKTCQNVLAQHFEETLAFMQVRHLNIFFAGINGIGVDQRQYDKGAEHVQNQRCDHIFRVQHGHIRAHNRHGNGRHRRCSHGVHAVTGHFAEDIFISDKVLRLAEDQRADGVKRFQFAHTVYFGQQETNSADDHWQNTDMLKNTDQRGNKDDRAQYFQEEERQTLIVHTAEDEVCPFVGKSEQFFKHLGETFYEAKANIRIQEEPGQ
ncbi:hypothetical protein LTSEGIV_3424 [Salmonella enterica subsp. enterica serovar Give str. S5-487]|nr:hypothetical protein LTSEGIV_3424 [Salmonella enterica subsp. enterica serovar Give str. S5-487]